MQLMNAGELDIEEPEQLLEWLRSTGHISPDEAPRIEVLAGGVSNRTVRVERTTPHRDAWVIKQALPKLRVDVDWYSDPARVHREALGLRWLERLAPPGSIAPRVAEDQTHHVLIMQAVPRPHENWKTALLAGRIDPALCQQFGKLIGTIHREAFLRRDELFEDFSDRSFFESLRLEPYYGYTAQQVPTAAGFLQALMDATRARQLTLVHGDYSPKNILVHNERLVLLDHEVIHWGDPAFDLGFGLTHLLSKARHLSHLQTEFAAAARAVWQSYLVTLQASPWQAGLEQHVVRHTLGCLLARVAGRSPLEYLDRQERAAQQQRVLQLLHSVPDTVEELVQRVVEPLQGR